MRGKREVRKRKVRDNKGKAKRLSRKVRIRDGKER